MNAESMNKQEQLHIKDNETLQVEKSDHRKLHKVDSLSDISSKPAENINEVVSPSMQISSDSYDNKVCCQSDEQFSESLHKAMTIDIDSEAAGTAEVKTLSVLELSDDYLIQMMKNNNDRGIALYGGAFLVSDETECSKVLSDNATKENFLPVQQAVVVDVSNRADNSAILDKIEMVVENNQDRTSNADVKDKLMTIDDTHIEEVDNYGDIDKSDTSQQDLLPNTELLIADKTNSFNDTKKNEKELRLDKIGIVVVEKNDDTMETLDLKEKPMLNDDALAEEVDKNENIDKSDTSTQDLLFNTELLIADETSSSNDTKETGKELTLDKIEIVVEKNNDTMETLDLKEKPMSTDDALDEEVYMKKHVDKSIPNEQDFLSSGEHFMIDKSNTSDNINESKNVFCSENIDKLKSVSVDVSDGKMPVAMLENIDVKKGFSRHELKDINSNEESSVIIDNMQNMKWLKHFGGNMEGNRRKLSRKPSIEAEDIIKDVKEEPIEDAKLNSKSAKKRSSQSKNRKAKAVDSPKQDTFEDQNKKSSSDVQLVNTSKNEISKSINAQAVEKSKETKSSSQILELPRSSIGRGRNDRRKDALGYSKPKAQSDTSDQWNKSPSVRLEIPAMEEKRYNKDKAHLNAGSSSVEVEVGVKKVESVVVTDSSNSRKPEVCETEITSRLPDQPDNSVFLHNQSSVKNNENELSAQKNEEKIDMKKKQLSLVKNYEDSQNKTNKNLSSRPIYGRSTNESNPEKIPSLSVKGFSQDMHDFNKQENSATKNTGIYNTSHDAPRWNHNNYSNRQQNMNTSVFNSQKGFTSNRHRNITEDENRQKEESFGKNQVTADKYQGSKWYSDKCYDNKTSSSRYNERNQDNRHSNYQYSDKNQDHRNHSEWNSIKNQDGKSYRDIVSDNKNQSSRGDRYFLNQNNNGFGEGYSERFPDRAHGERYSDKVRDSKNFTDRYPDRNQQSKTFNEISSNRHHDENQMATKKQEPLNRNSVGFDKNNDSNQAKDKEFSNRQQVNSGNYRDIRNFSKKNNDLHVGERHKEEQEMMDKFRNQFLKTPEPENSDKVKQSKSEIKSQKHYDNIQQAKVQKGVHQLQQSFSVPPVVHQLELSSSVNQNVKLHEKDKGLTNTQPIQSGDWTYKNISKQDAVHSADLRCASPNTNNTNMTVNPTVTNEYDSQYNDESLLNSSNQFQYSVSSVTASEQKPNVVMAFEGNQNVQRALGMDPSHFNQSQSSQVNTNDLFRSNTNSPTPQQVCTSTKADQYYQTITSGLVNTLTTSAYSHSTMNVNAPPFEVTSNEKLNNQLMCMHSAISNSQAGLIAVDNEFILHSVFMNELSNSNEEQLKLHQEISELSKKLAIKQSELVNLQMKMINAAKAATKAVLNQSINPSLQHICHSPLVQQQNQPLLSNYAQVKYQNFPPGFGDVPLNVQSTQINVSDVSTSAANVQNYPVEKLPLNCLSEPRINVQPVYLAQGNVLYQQQTANYQTYTDQTANSAAYNIIPQK